MGGSNCDRNFYPRSPCGERHTKHFPALHHILISIHALLAESDANVNRRGAECVNFYPRSPCGERRCQTLSDCRYTAFLSTLSLRRATLTSFKGTYSSFHQFLSTLSLRRATLGARHRHAHNLAFLSTLSLRRATYLTGSS